MKVLISAGSKHGATEEIAAQIRDALRERGIDGELVSPDAVMDVGGYDAVILGSAIYAGRWRPEMKSLVERLEEQLRELPVWVFSSGPLGDPPTSAQDPVDAKLMTDRTGAREHMLFAGKLDRTKLNFVERSMVKAVKAPYGDYRDWDEIREWADRIASDLVALPIGVHR
jgi:menaquinone-dependent protoporphyrinogen oxidase